MNVRVGMWKTAAMAAVLGAALSGCTISIPDAPPAATETATSAPTTYAPPKIVAGHDAAAVAGAPMTFAAGNTLQPGVPVEFSDALGQPTEGSLSTPGPPEWKLLKNNVAGATQYSNAPGCQLAHWTTSNQAPLISAGNDKSSTINLMKYLIPSVTESALTEAKLPWVGEAGKKGPAISFLAFTIKAGKGVMASTVWARMLGTADTGLVVTLTCPTDDLLASTTPKMMTKLSVAPPSN
ncbi:hypothetical protein [Arthrobacter sp. BF1]|uniref:hypothetical protein n=1 Tax=Arthrobacter sp. BF1 TaxID=2821145 RepID=UPI001C4EAA45|nr:hypothetical protein [Arthrobacter sp. BF1]